MKNPLKLWEPQFVSVNLESEEHTDNDTDHREIIPFFSRLELPNYPLMGRIVLLDTWAKLSHIQFDFDGDKNSMSFGAGRHGITIYDDEILCRCSLKPNGEIIWDPEYQSNTSTHTRLAVAVIEGAINGGEPQPDNYRWWKGPQLNAFFNLDNTKNVSDYAQYLDIDVFGPYKDGCNGIMRVYHDHTDWLPYGMAFEASKPLTEFAPCPQTEFLQQVAQEIRAMLPERYRNNTKIIPFPWYDIEY